MADNSLATLNITNEDAELAAIAATKNDLSKLDERQRAQLYGAICRSMGLNPLTSPFEYVALNGKLTLYAKKGATDQLRAIQGIDIVSMEREILGDILMVTVTAKTRDGRQDTELGAVNIAGLRGEALANAYMKANTKAKRRVTLSLCGLGWMDETEVDTIPNARYVDVDTKSGVISGNVEPERTAYNEAEYWNNANRRLHAVAEKYGVTHDDLHLWASDRGKDSLKDFVPDALDLMANKLENDTGAALAYFRKLRADTTALPESQPENSVSEEPGETYEGEYTEIDPDTGEIIPPGTDGRFQSPLIDMPMAAHPGHGES